MNGLPADVWALALVIQSLVSGDIPKLSIRPRKLADPLNYVESQYERDVLDYQAHIQKEGGVINHLVSDFLELDYRKRPLLSSIPIEEIARALKELPD